MKIPTYLRLLMNNFYKILLLKLFILRRKNLVNVPEYPWAYLGGFNTTLCFLIHLWLQTNESYFRNLTERNKSNVLADNVISPKDIWGTLGVCKHDTQFSGATKTFSFLFGAENIFLPTVGLVNPTPQTRQNKRVFKRRFLETRLSVIS